MIPSLNTIVTLTSFFWHSHIYPGRLPCSSNGKECACEAEDLGLIPGLGSSSGGGNGNSLQYCLENSMDREVWQAIEYGVTKSQTWVSDSHTHTHTHLSKRSPNDSRGKESACNARGESLIPGLGRSPGRGNGGLQSTGPKESDTIEHKHACMHAFTYPNVSAWSCHSHANDSYLF